MTCSVDIGPTFRALGPSFASVRKPCLIQSDLVRRSFMVPPYTCALTGQSLRHMFHAEVYGYELARRCAGNGWGHRKRRRSGSRRPGTAADGRTVRAARGQADRRSDPKDGAAAPAIQHVQLVRRRTRLDRRCKLVRAGGKLATGLLVGSSYLFGALGNLWATRGRHPGWMLYAVALVLIVYGVGRAGG